MMTSESNSLVNSSIPDIVIIITIIQRDAEHVSSDSLTALDQLYMYLLMAALTSTVGSPQKHFFF
jgi:hypothetical protein